MDITSEAFEDGEEIPIDYTCDGEDINPPLSFEDIPDDTKSMVLIVDDPDAPNGTWTHWVVFNIDPNEDIKEDSVPGIQGRNDFDREDWGGPCPPDGQHRYFFRAYALDMKLGHEEGVSRGDIEQAMDDHILDQAVLMATYERE